MEVAEKSSYLVALPAVVSFVNRGNSNCNGLLSKSAVEFGFEFIFVRISWRVTSHCGGRNLRQSSRIHAAQETRDKTFYSWLVEGIFFCGINRLRLPRVSFQRIIFVKLAALMTLKGSF